MTWSVYQGDALAILRELPDESYDGSLSDPPYGIDFMGHEWDCGVPSAAVWRELLRVLKPGAPLLAYGGTRKYHRLTCAIEDAGFEIRDCLQWLYGQGFPKNYDLGDGLGTALKPAYEPIVLARKPLDGTLEQNLAKHGVGALAIDACRVYTDWEERSEAWKRSGHSARPDAEKIAAPPGTGITCHDLGRWPANVILDEDAGALLDAQTGTRRPGERPAQRAGLGYESTSEGTNGVREVYDAGGGPSRYFYCPKATREERDAGLDDFEAMTGGDATGRDDDSAGTKSPRAGAGRTGGAKNVHPTVKPIALNRYLARLIRVREGARMVVPFCGSGSEMIGALHAGWGHVDGIDNWDVAVAIARARLTHHTGFAESVAQEDGGGAPRKPRALPKQLPMFGEGK